MNLKICKKQLLKKGTLARFIQPWRLGGRDSGNNFGVAEIGSDNGRFLYIFVSHKNSRGTQLYLLLVFARRIKQTFSLFYLKTDEANAMIVLY